MLAVPQMDSPQHWKDTWALTLSTLSRCDLASGEQKWKSSTVEQNKQLVNNNNNNNNNKKTTNNNNKEDHWIPIFLVTSGDNEVPCRQKDLTFLLQASQSVYANSTVHLCGPDWLSHSEYATFPAK